MINIDLDANYSLAMKARQIDFLAEHNVKASEVQQKVTQTKKPIKLLDVEQVISDIKTLLTETHGIKQIKKAYKNYKGIDITHYSILAHSNNIKESVSKKSDLDTILLKLFQLGFQQGLNHSENSK